MARPRFLSQDAAWLSMALVLLAITQFAFIPTSLAQAPPPDHSPIAVDQTENIPSEWTEVISDIQRRFGLTWDTAYDRVAGQERRIAFRGALPPLLGDRFAGFRFDMLSGIQTVLVTDVQVGTLVMEAADQYDVAAAVELDSFSYNTLVATAQRITDGRDPILSSVASSANPNDNNNTVEVFVPAAALALLRARAGELHPAVHLFETTPNLSVDEACTGKPYNCGAPLRGGIGVWHEGEPYTSPSCSLGYTATGSDGSWWAITAGHCSITRNSNAGEDFGHGEQVFGPMRHFKDTTLYPYNLDYLRARIDNSYWRQIRPGGYLVQVNSSNLVVNAPVILEGYVAARYQIEKDEYVCLVAVSPDAGDACGVISDEYATYNMPQVEYDACPGDSGGAWVWRASSGLIGYGIHQGGRTGCPQLEDPPGQNDSRGWSQFTTIPDLHQYWDQYVLGLPFGSTLGEASHVAHWL